MHVYSTLYFVSWLNKIVKTETWGYKISLLEQLAWPAFWFFSTWRQLSDSWLSGCPWSWRPWSCAAPWWPYKLSPSSPSGPSCKGVLWFYCFSPISLSSACNLQNVLLKRHDCILSGLFHQGKRVEPIVETRGPRNKMVNSKQYHMSSIPVWSRSLLP